MCTSVSSSGPAWAAEGIDTTIRAPTGTVTPGAGDISLRVKEGEPADSEHDDPIGAVFLVANFATPGRFVGTVVVEVDEPAEPHAPTATPTVAMLRTAINLRPEHPLSRYAIGTTSNPQ